MNKAYEQKDLDAFLSDVSASYPGRASFAKSLAEVFAKYETIHFNVQYAKMIIMIEQKGPVRTTFTWDAEWQMAGGGTMKDGGRVTLVFEPGGLQACLDRREKPLPCPAGRNAGEASTHSECGIRNAD